MGAISENYYPIRRPINLNELDGYREDVYVLIPDEWGNHSDCTLIFSSCKIIYL